MENRYAASAIIYDREGRVLIAKRSLTKRPYPNTWSLPSTYLRGRNNELLSIHPSEEEMKDQLILKIQQKLGIIVTLKNIIGKMKGKQLNYTLTMTDFIGEIVGGKIKPNQKDYSKAGFYDPIEKLGENPKGLCARILINRLKENPNFLKELD
jgi:hypothetical protein